VVLYPFFLDGVALDASLNQGDGMHPNPAGVRIVVDRMAPVIEKLLPTS
jgi:acyl-CoA thioesterase-1